MKKIIKLLSSFLLAIILLTSASTVFAADTIEDGLEQVDTNIVLNNTSPVVIVVKIINFALMFLGIIAVSLVIYGGFVWMTSNGKEENISTAKKILKNALIGLIIILASWGIVSFILTKLTGGGSGSSVNDFNVKKQNYQIGLGSVGACVVENFYPGAEKSNVPRNSSIMITFKEEVAPESVCVDGDKNPCACSTTCNKLNPRAIQIFKKEIGNACGDAGCNDTNTNFLNATVGLSFDKKTIVVIPKEYLGEANVSVPYAVRITGEVKNLRNENIFSKCQPNFLEWGFIVNGLVDLTPPIVTNNGIFPPVDNYQDIYTAVESKSATSTIEVLRGMNPDKEVGFRVTTLTGTTGVIDNRSFVMSNSYQETNSSSEDVYIVTVDASKTLLITADGKPRGSAIPTEKDGDYFVDFSNIFSFKLKSVVAGNSWKVIVEKPYSADKITIAGFEIVFKNPLNKLEAAQLIADSINNSGLFKSANVVANVVTIVAKPGVLGDNSEIISAKQDAIKITPFVGGENGGSILSTKDKPDQPMNSTIQINFSKEINPITITGPSDYVSSTIQVVNILDNKPIKGTFVLSSDYKTLEFLSNEECGMNGCGEKIHCLPSKSNLKVVLSAAKLESCLNDVDCSSRTPFNSCKNILASKSCANISNKFYPAADILSLKGVIDASGNSFDGNRDTYADGPGGIFNQNITGVSGKDNYQWSFFVSDKIEASTPKIISILPASNANNVDVNIPVSITFNRLMLNSTLTTGYKTINNGKGDVVHKFLNIRSFGEPVGYWISSNNISLNDNGVMDRTIVDVNHSVFSSASAFNAQAGSGVRDIYQNCFKPSGGVDCAANSENPSCCFGTAKSNDLGLDTSGNCQ